MDETMYERFNDHPRSAVVIAQDVGVRYAHFGKEQTSAAL
jgi:hypothetical protein